MLVGSRGLAALGSASMNVLGAWLWHFVWPLPPRPLAPAACIDCGGWGYVMTSQPSLNIESRAGSLSAAAAAGGASGPRKSCHASDPIDHDPYVVGITRPLVFDAYAPELGLCVEVGAGGTVGRVRVLRGSGSAGTDRAAIDWLRSLRFQPASRQGRPVASWHRMTIGHGWPHSPPPL